MSAQCATQRQQASTSRVAASPSGRRPVRRTAGAGAQRVPLAHRPSPAPDGDRQPRLRSEVVASLPHPLAAAIRRLSRRSERAEYPKEAEGAFQGSSPPPKPRRDRHALVADALGAPPSPLPQIDDSPYGEIS